MFSSMVLKKHLTIDSSANAWQPSLWCCRKKNKNKTIISLNKRLWYSVHAVRQIVSLGDNPVKCHNFSVIFVRRYLFVCHYWQWPILINCVMCYYLCVLRWLMRPILALNCLLQIEQERSEEESSVGDALALAFRYARFCSASLILVFTSSPFYEASPLCTILCNLFPWLSWYVEVFKGGFEGVLVSLLLTTMGAFSYLKFSIEDFLGQTFIRHSGNMACPS